MVLSAPSELFQQRPFLTSAGVLLGLVLVRWVYYLIYNVTFHPLASFPGPLAARASFLPQFIARGKGDIRYVKKLHDRYGTVVRISPNELSFTGSRAWKDIYGHKPGQKQLPKQIVVDSPELVLKAPHLILAPDDAHSRMRRNLSHAFSAQAVNEQENLMKTHFDKMIMRIREQAEKNPDGVVDMEKMYNCVAFDIIGDLAFGESFGALDQFEYHEYMVGVLTNLKVFSMFQRLSVYKWMLKGAGTMMSVIPAAVRGRIRHFKFAADRVEGRIARDTDRRDFMWYILKHNEKEGRGLSKQEIYSNSGLLIGAGSETTATTLTGATFYLVNNPPILEKLNAEIRGAFKSASDITISTASRLPYLVAVMEEAMRLYPPVPASNVRVTEKPTEIDGRLVAPGTRVAVQQYSTHRAASNFSDPESFLPERWLANPEPRFANDNRDSVHPFSQGPRNCLGKNLAYAELYSIMARIVYNFDMERGPIPANWLEQDAFIFWQKGPLWIRMTPRTK